MKQHIAKIFMNRKSQAVRLPKEFNFDDDKVIIRKQGDEVILSPCKKSWDTFFKETPLPTDDFMETREDIPAQKREFNF